MTSCSKNPTGEMNSKVQNTCQQRTANAARVYLPADQHAADGNILPGHPAERASWIWSPHRGPQDPAFLSFRLSFDWSGAKPLRIHVTADNRYRLFLDGRLISCGPDRSDVAHWAVATLDMELEAGEHTLEAEVWYIAENPLASRMDPKHAGGDLALGNPPMAQMTYRPGFLLAGHGDTPRGVLDTGSAPWTVSDMTAAVSLAGPENLGYHDIGPEFTYDMKVWKNGMASAGCPDTVAHPPVYNTHGIRNPGWVLTSSPLPEQKRVAESTGAIRAVRTLAADDEPWNTTENATTRAWQSLLSAKAALEIPPRTSAEVLWDLEKYECGYPDLAWSGGAGTRIALHWAESLFEVSKGAPLDAESPRGHRDKIEGKRWLGFGDTFVASGASDETSPALWWRAGRYLRLRVETADEPLTMRRLGIVTTGYPFKRDFTWISSDSEWNALLPLLARGLELNGHELWADCPYYEQMMYVGDNVLHALSNYIGYRDDRLTRRTLGLLDWSRAGSRGGLVAERYPAAWRQEAATFAMLYPQMMRNFLYWRDDPEFVITLLPGLRQLIESLLSLRGRSGLLGTVPGWPFVDWVPTWHQGCGPGVREGDSSIVNLHLVHALRNAARVERAVGESVLADRAETHARDVFERLSARYWDAERQIFRDTSDPTASTSEHAQVLALLTGWLDSRRAAGCLRALRERRLDAECTIYFSHYLLEAFFEAGEADAFFERLAFWRTLPGKGFCSLPEMPDPCRSDCHGWGAHPLFHTFASIAGIRPAAAGFAKVSIRPMPGKLTFFTATVPHPAGTVTVDFLHNDEGENFSIDLPEGVSGELFWLGKRYALDGKTTVRTKALCASKTF